MGSANKVALNTAILYGRMLITVGISLYTTRVVLNALGSTDYGIFNLIAGVITMLSFLNAAMATSTQRFLSYYHGKKDLKMQKKVFTNSLILHVVIGIVIVFFLEILGLLLFDGFLNIPLDRVSVAKIIYHYMSATVFFTIISVPFNGMLVAEENMLWVAFVNIIETLLKLAIASVLYYISSDKLILYGQLTAGISIVSFTLYATYCLRKYENCTVQGILKIDKALIVKLGSFAGWNLFGSLCGMARSQGLALVLNVFLGAVINAAYGIANQVATQLSFFSLTMLRALNPQIMKSEGANDRKRMLWLAMIASKFGFFLLSILAIPCIFEMPQLLSFWLKNVPDQAVTFCQLILVGSMINQLTIGLPSAIQATGNIKMYQSVVGTMLLLNLPIAYLLLKSNLPGYFVLISYCCVELVACVLRLYFLSKLAGLNVREYIDRVIAKEIIPVLTAVVFSYLMVHYLQFKYRFIISICTSGLLYLVAIYYTGLCHDEKAILLKGFNKIIDKIKKNNNKSISAG